MEHIRMIHQFRRQSGWDQQGTLPVCFLSTINGYHHYRVRPLEGINFPMECIPEPNNRYDSFAVAVRAPSSVAEEFLNQETRPMQFVRDILGSVVGHVPRNICNIMSVSLNVHRTLRKATCFYIGGFIHDNSGPRLKCIYLLEFVEGADLLEVGNYLRRFIAEDDIYL